VVAFASSELEVLSIVREKGSLSLDNLQKLAKFSDRTVRKAVGRLKSLGLVAERPVLADLRRKVITAGGGR